MSSKKKIAALAIAGVGVIGYSALWVVPAFATSGTTTTVNWLMPKGATATNPLWPQDLLQGSIPCERVIQKDVYTTDKKDDERLKMSADKRLASFIAEITADKKLTWSNGQSEDSALAAKYGVKIAWSFVQGEKCSTPTPTKPTETPTPTVTVTTPKPTETTSTPTPVILNTVVSERVCTATTFKFVGYNGYAQLLATIVIGNVTYTPVYGTAGGLHIAAINNPPQGAYMASVTVVAENEKTVTYKVEVPAATGCTTATPTVTPTSPTTAPTTPTTPATQSPVVNPPSKATTKATVEAISTQHPGIGG